MTEKACETETKKVEASVSTNFSIATKNFPKAAILTVLVLVLWAVVNWFFENLGGWGIVVIFFLCLLWEGGTGIKWVRKVWTEKDEEKEPSSESGS